MKDTVIIYNQNNPLACSLYKSMCAWLSQRGISAIGYDSHTCKPGQAGSDADFAVSLGGDGTFLACARALAPLPIPILPIHLGSFGFITEVTHDEWQEAMESWIDGVLDIEERMVLDISVLRKTRKIASFTGVNEIVVDGIGISKLVRLSIKLGDFFAGGFLGDGIILSTPTGSTAYSMAAGGPILVPPMAAMVLTPICPFSLSWRPMVIPDYDPVLIKIDMNQRVDLLLTVDGQMTHPLHKGDDVLITGRRGGVKIIKSNRRGFYEVLRSKFGWSGEPSA